MHVDRRLDCRYSVNAWRRHRKQHRFWVCASGLSSEMRRTDRYSIFPFSKEAPPPKFLGSLSLVFPSRVPRVVVGIGCDRICIQAY